MTAGGARSCLKINYILCKQDFISSTVANLCPSFFRLCMSWKHIHNPWQNCLTEGGIYSRIEFIISIRDVSSMPPTLDGHFSFA